MSIFKGKPTDEQLLVKAKTLAKSCTITPQRLCTFGVVYEDGTGAKEIGGQCHAAVDYFIREQPDYRDFFSTAKTHPKIKSGAKPRYLSEGIARWTEHYKTDEAKEGLALYLDFMFNRSPYAKIFITKDAREAMRDGCIIDCRYPTALIQGALICLRSLSESEDTRWKIGEVIKMLRAGVDGNLALLLYPALMKRGKAITFTDTNTGHRPIAAYKVSVDDFMHWMNGVPKKGREKGRGLYSDRTDYSGVFNVWHGTEDQRKKGAMTVLFNCMPKRQKSTEEQWGKPAKVTSALGADTYIKDLADMGDNILNEMGVIDS